MKKEIREVKEGIIRITTVDERWYVRSVKDETTGLPKYEFVPSVSWIASFYPKGIGFYKWLANTGWDEAEALKEAAGDKGSKVHYAIEDLLKGKEIKINDKYLNPTTEEEEELTLEEYQCLMSFSEWFNKVKPEIIANELTAFNETEKYAGTIDLICRIDNQIWLIDLKTSQNIWAEHELQISAYSHLDINLEEIKISSDEWKNKKLAILQIGYKRNKENWKFTEIKDKFDLFLSAKKIWGNETEGVEPPQKDYPLSLKLTNLVRSVKKKTDKKEV